MPNSGSIDRDWFMEKLLQQGKSVRGLAKFIGIDPSAVSRMLSGERRMRVEEVEKIASFLAVPTSEVMRRAGNATIAGDRAASPLMLAATIDERGAIISIDDASPLPAAILRRAHNAISQGYGGNIVAAQVRASEGPLGVMDDAIVLYALVDTVDARATGALSVYKTADGNQYFGRIKYARKTGEALIQDATGNDIEVMLTAATPVMAIIP